MTPGNPTVTIPTVTISNLSQRGCHEPGIAITTHSTYRLEILNADVLRLIALILRERKDTVTLKALACCSRALRAATAPVLLKHIFTSGSVYPVGAVQQLARYAVSSSADMWTVDPLSVPVTCASRAVSTMLQTSRSLRACWTIYRISQR